MKFPPHSIAEYKKGLSAKTFSVSEAVSSYEKNIKAKNSELGAYLEVFSDLSEQVEMLSQKDTTLPLYGVPLAVKDNILISGKKCSAGSKILENYTAPYDAYVIRKLRDAGAIFLGRTNMDEFAMGGSTERSAYFPARNPFDTKRVPGGSSGGSAAALAGDLALAALGSDTGGSVREPASFCGVVGLKPTYGRLSRSGLIAMASSLDQIGPLTKTVEDAQILFEVMQGSDPNDSTSAAPEEKKIPNSKKLAYPEHLFAEGLDTEVLQNFERVKKHLTSLGYTLTPLEIPSLSYALYVYYVIMPAESSSNLARFDGVRYGLSKRGENHIDSFFKTRGVGFGPEVKRRIMLGSYVLSAGYYDAYYAKATAVRDMMRSDFHELFKTYAGVIMPTVPAPAFPLGAKTQDPVQMYLADIFTVSANLLGVPAISVPTGFTEGDMKLPLGTQILTPWFSESLLFEIAVDLEKITRE